MLEAIQSESWKGRYMVSSLKLQNGAMVGTLAGKPLFCFVRATRGSTLPSGEYIARGPMQDPIYGPVAILVRTGAGSATQAPTYQWIQQPPGGAPTISDFSVSMMGAGGGGGSGVVGAGDWEDAMMGGGGGGGSGFQFVVAGRAIPGWNCLVVTFGLTDLMDALKLAGSALITVG
jgi:hypothetical protein